MSADAIDRFAGVWRPLSSFAEFTVVFDGVEYPTLEHGYHAAKSLSPHVRESIRRLATPGDAKRAGRLLALRPGWDTVRDSVMWILLRDKFARHTLALNTLRRSGDAQLVEGNTWHDQYWGDCRCGRTACAEPGQNRLGQLLTALRAEMLANDVWLGTSGTNP